MSSKYYGFEKAIEQIGDIYSEINMYASEELRTLLVDARKLMYKEKEELPSVIKPLYKVNEVEDGITINDYFIPDEIIEQGLDGEEQTLGYRLVDKENEIYEIKRMITEATESDLYYMESDLEDLEAMKEEVKYVFGAYGTNGFIDPHETPVDFNEVCESYLELIDVALQEKNQNFLNKLYNMQHEASKENAMQTDSPSVLVFVSYDIQQNLFTQGAMIDEKNPAKVIGLEADGIQTIYDIEEREDVALMVKKNEDDRFILTTGDYNELADDEIFKKVMAYYDDKKEFLSDLEVGVDIRSSDHPSISKICKEFLLPQISSPAPRKLEILSKDDEELPEWVKNDTRNLFSKEGDYLLRDLKSGDFFVSSGDTSPFIEGDYCYDPNDEIEILYLLSEDGIKKIDKDLYFNIVDVKSNGTPSLTDDLGDLFKVEPEVSTKNKKESRENNQKQKAKPSPKPN